ncbi:MAG: hypothetical protein KAT14_01110 [Candidatus Marinimicrobia bacterium]|nr:hypothetical protein [Candidatus Neomarinimicrobiota bacterium]
MKKIISVILLIAMVFMLEFNLLESVLPKLHPWVESILAFGAMAAVVFWNKTPDTAE